MRPSRTSSPAGPFRVSGVADIISVRVIGASALAAALTDGDLVDALLRPGFEQAAVIVEGAAKGNAHRVTGKLQGSLGQFIDGHGADIAAHIGPQPGLGQPRGYSASQTSRWKKPRQGRNTGDPTVYGLFEEKGTRYREGHPFLEPALTDNLGRIEDVITAGAQAGIDRMARRR